MAIYNVHVLANRNGDDEHVQQTSTGTADVKTFTKPALATACFITVETTNARVTFGGDTPDASNGLIVLKDSQPLYFPVAADIKFVSTAAANCIVNVMWLE